MEEQEVVVERGDGEVVVDQAAEAEADRADRIRRHTDATGGPRRYSTRSSRRGSHRTAPALSQSRASPRLRDALPAPSNYATAAAQSGSARTEAGLPRAAIVRAIAASVDSPASYQVWVAAEQAV
jgi:hypothetical protein